MSCSGLTFGDMCEIPKTNALSVFGERKMFAKETAAANFVELRISG
jgi:hypothetical protein